MRSRWLQIEAALSLTLARAWLVMPARLLRGAGGATASPIGEEPSTDPLVRAVTVALVRAARRLPWSSTCLVRALAGRSMLRRRGISSVLHLGVSTRNGRLTAHAWLTVGNATVIGGNEAPDFVPLARLAPTPRGRNSRPCQ